MNCLMLINLWLFLWEFQPDPVMQNPSFQFVTVSDTLIWLCRPEEKKVFFIAFKIREGYHIQSNNVSDENLIPTTVTLTNIPPDIQLNDPVFPESRDFKLNGSDVPMKVFHHILMVNYPGKVKKEATTGTFMIQGNLHYQVCDSVKCYFPRDLPFAINLIIQE
jgi:hypothetical protein